MPEQEHPLDVALRQFEAQQAPAPAEHPLDLALRTAGLTPPPVMVTGPLAPSLASAVPAPTTAPTLGPPAAAEDKYNIPDLTDAPHPTLSPQEEQQFQTWVKGTQWFKEFKPKYGEDPNLDSPEYDLRAAWKAGVIPELNQADKTYHWADATPDGKMLKSVYHPTAWMGPFMQQFHVNPDDLPADDPRIVGFKKAWQDKYPPATTPPPIAENPQPFEGLPSTQNYDETAVPSAATNPAVPAQPSPEAEVSPAATPPERAGVLGLIDKGTELAGKVLGGMGSGAALAHGQEPWSEEQQAASDLIGREVTRGWLKGRSFGLYQPPELTDDEKKLGADWAQTTGDFLGMGGAIKSIATTVAPGLAQIGIKEVAPALTKEFGKYALGEAGVTGFLYSLFDYAGRQIGDQTAGKQFEGWSPGMISQGLSYAAAQMGQPEVAQAIQEGAKKLGPAAMAMDFMTFALGGAVAAKLLSSTMERVESVRVQAQAQKTATADFNWKTDNVDEAIATLQKAQDRTSLTPTEQAKQGVNPAETEAINAARDQAIKENPAFKNAAIYLRMGDEFRDTDGNLLPADQIEAKLTEVQARVEAEKQAAAAKKAAPETAAAPEAPATAPGQPVFNTTGEDQIAPSATQALTDLRAKATANPDDAWVRRGKAADIPNDGATLQLMQHKLVETRTDAEGNVWLRAATSGPSAAPEAAPAPASTNLKPPASGPITVTGADTEEAARTSATPATEAAATPGVPPSPGSTVAPEPSISPAPNPAVYQDDNGWWKIKGREDLPNFGSQEQAAKAADVMGLGKAAPAAAAAVNTGAGAPIAPTGEYPAEAANEAQSPGAQIPAPQPMGETFPTGFGGESNTGIETPGPVTSETTPTPTLGSTENAAPGASGEAGLEAATEIPSRSALIADIHSAAQEELKSGPITISTAYKNYTLTSPDQLILKGDNVGFRWRGKILNLTDSQIDQIAQQVDQQTLLDRNMAESGASSTTFTLPPGVTDFQQKYGTAEVSPELPRPAEMIPSSDGKSFISPAWAKAHPELDKTSKIKIGDEVVIGGDDPLKGQIKKIVGEKVFGTTPYWEIEAPAGSLAIDKYVEKLKIAGKVKSPVGPPSQQKIFPGAGESAEPQANTLLEGKGNKLPSAFTGVRSGPTIATGSRHPLGHGNYNWQQYGNMLRRGAQSMAERQAGVTPKQQKQTVLKTLDATLKGPFVHEGGSQFVEFHIPGDGDFKIRNEAPILEMMQKRFKTGIAIRGGKPNKLSLRPTGNRMALDKIEDLEYFTPIYHPKKTTMNFVPGDALYQNGVFSNGHYAIEMKDPGGWSKKPGTINIKDFVNQQAEASIPAQILGEYKGSEWGVGGQSTVIVEANGQRYAFAAKYFDLIYGEHPKATLFIAPDRSVGIFKEGNKPVAALMSMNMGAPYWKKLDEFITEAKPTATIAPAAESVQHPEIKEAKRKLPKGLTGKRTAKSSEIKNPETGQLSKEITMKFGEHIGGSRFDKTHGILTIGDLEGMTDREAQDLVNKQNIWRKPDYTSMVEEGTPAHVAWLIKKMRDALPTAPVKVDKRELFIREVGRVRDILSGIKSEDDLAGLFHRIFDATMYDSTKPQYASDRWSKEGNEAARILGNKFLKEIQVSNYDITQAKRKVTEKEWPFAKGTPTGKRTKMPERPMLESIERTGKDYRGGKDVTSEQFQKTFGFRGGEFGKWLDNKERQDSLNHAYDALMDLADLLGVPPKALSLEGELGFAFGARGGGHASAHYEPAKIVINLTKTRGAGATAHEWAHALDDYFGRQAGKTKLGEYASHGVTGGKLRAEMQAAWKNVSETMVRRYETFDEAKKSAADNVAKSKHYTESWLGGIRRGLTDENKLKLDALTSKILDGDKKAVQELFSFSRPDQQTKKGLLNNFDFLVRRLQRVEDLTAGKKAYNLIKTDFLKEANKLDKGKSNGYWSRHHELFARAFETYIESKIEDVGLKSQYLVHDTYTFSEGYKKVTGFSPYPQDVERATINKAFDNFFDILETAGSKRKSGAVALFRRHAKVKNTLGLRTGEQHEQNSEVRPPKNTGRQDVDLRTAGEEGRRFLDDLRADQEGALQPGDFNLWKGTRYSERLRETPEFQKVAQRAADLHILAVPAAGFPTPGALYTRNDGRRFLVLDDSFGEHTITQYAEHELFHHRIAIKDPAALALQEAVDIQSPEAQEYQQQLNKLNERLGWEQLAPQDVAEEIAADFAAGIRETGFGGRTIDVAGAFGDQETALQLYVRYKLWKPGLAPTGMAPAAAKFRKGIAGSGGGAPPEGAATGRPAWTRRILPAATAADKVINTWLGKKEAATLENTVIAHQRQQAIMQALDKKKFDRECKEIDEALTHYVELKAYPEDLKRYGKLSVRDQHIVDLSQKVIPKNPALQAIADAMQARYEDAYQVANRAGVVNDHRDNFMAHTWDLEKKGPPTEGQRKFGTTTGHARQRVFKTEIEGLTTINPATGKPYRPLVRGATNKEKIYHDDLADVVANREFVKQEMKKGGIFTDKWLEDTKLINHPQFKGWRWAGSIEVEPIITAIRRLSEKVRTSSSASASTTGGPGAAATETGPVQAMKEVVRNSLTARGMTEGEADAYINRIEQVAIKRAQGPEAPEAEKGAEKEATIIKELREKIIKIQEQQKIAGLKVKPLARKDLFIDGAGNIFQKTPLYAEGATADKLNNILGTSALRGIPWLDKTIKVANSIKHTVLFISGFHHQAGVRASIFGVTGQGLKALNIRRNYRQGLKMIYELNPIIARGVKVHGLKLGVTPIWREYLSSEKSKLGARLDQWKATKAVKDKVFDLWDAQVNFLFGKLFPGLQAMMYAAEVRNGVKKFPDADPDEIGQHAAELSNYNFGNINYARMGRNPTLQHIFQALFLAPQWTESNYKPALKLVQAMGQGDKVKTYFYRKFWASILLKGAAALLLGNLLLGLADDKNAWERFKLAWQAGHLRWLGWDITGVYHKIYAALGIEPSQQRKYFSPLGHFLDAIKMVSHPILFLHHKGSPLYRFFHEAITGHNWKDQPFTSLGDLAGLTEGGKLKGHYVKEGKSQGPVSLSQIPSLLINQAREAVPIPAGNLIAWLSGEMDGFDALTKSGGSMVSSYTPKTDAQKLMGDYFRSMGSGMTPTQREHFQLRQDLLKMERQGDELGFEMAVNEAVTDGKLTWKQAALIRKDALEPEGADQFKRLPLQVALQVFQAGTEDEKEAWQPALLRKVAGADPGTLAELQDPLEELLSGMGLSQTAGAVGIMAHQPYQGQSAAAPAASKPFGDAEAAKQMNRRQAFFGQSKTRAATTKVPSTTKRNNFKRMGF